MIVGTYYFLEHDKSLWIILYLTKELHLTLVVMSQPLS